MRCLIFALAVYVYCLLLPFGECEDKDFEDASVVSTNGFYNITTKKTQSSLSCGLTVNVTGTVTITWYNGLDVIKSDDHHIITYQHDPPHSTLNFTKLGQIRGGEYLCNITSPHKSVVRHVTLFTTPGVQIAHGDYAQKSVNLVEGSGVELECSAWGFPLPMIYWRRGDEPQLNMSDERISISCNNGTNNGYPVFKSTLKFNNMALDDRDYYYCDAESHYNLSVPINETQFLVTATILIRVKDHLLPLWPFLGILAEAIILIIIIVVYEIRRKKQKAAQESKDSGETQNLTSAHNAGNTDVRRRK